MWNYNRDEPSNALSTNSKSFKYKASITGDTSNVGDGEDNYDAEKVGKKKNWNCYSTKIFKQFLKNFKYTIN